MFKSILKRLYKYIDFHLIVSKDDGPAPKVGLVSQQLLVTNKVNVCA